MKTKIFLTCIFLLGFFLVPLSVLAAASVFGEDLTGVDLVGYFYSISALSVLVMTVTQGLKKIIVSSGRWTVFLSWIISFVLSAVGWFLKLGIFEGVSFYWIFVYGLAAGLLANKIIDSKTIKSILSVFRKDKEVE